MLATLSGVRRDKAPGGGRGVQPGRAAIVGVNHEAGRTGANRGPSRVLREDRHLGGGGPLSAKWRVWGSKDSPQTTQPVIMAGVSHPLVGPRVSLWDESRTPGRYGGEAF
jgi:hypothetical protein